MIEPRIGLKEIVQLYERLSKYFELNFPDYVVFQRILKTVGSIKVWLPEQVGGNLGENHKKHLYLTAKVDGEYLGSEDVIELIADSQNKVSVLTAIHEFLHYRNKHKGIAMSEDGTEREAKHLLKKTGY